MIIIKNFLPTDAGLFSIFLKSLCYCFSSWLLKYSFFKNGHSFIHFMLPDRIRFYKTDNFPLSHRQYQLLMHIIFLCKIPVARFRWQLQYSRLLQLVHWGKMNWKVQYLMGECDTLGKEMTQLTEDKFFVVNTQTGKLVVAGYYDTNNNNKYDKQIRMKF